MYLIFFPLCQVTRQSQLLRGVFPALFHPLPAPVWADDVDNRVNFGMEIGQSVLCSARLQFLYNISHITHMPLSLQHHRENKRVLQVRRHGDCDDRLDPRVWSHQHYEGSECPVTT